MEIPETGDSLVFYVNGKKIIEPNPDPSLSLLYYLRRTLLPGTKEGCGHGGCGSCTVMVSRYDVNKQQINHYSVNACLFPLCAAYGCAITTVEGVGNPKTGLHDIQKRLVESHGLQCGFCTPGFVMSAFTLLRNNPKPCKEDIERALEGNLCRCTGYRPILDAFSSYTQECCQMGEECCRIRKAKKSQGPVESVADNISSINDTQVPIFPAELQLPNEYHSKFAHFCSDKMKWYRPTTQADLVSLKNQFPDAPVIMGNTTTAMNLKQENYTNVIYGETIDDMKTAYVGEKGFRFGSALTLSEFRKELTKLCNNVEERKRRHFPSLMTMIDRYGSDQIRNVASLGGSIQSGRSNSDAITLLTALGASVEVASVNGERTVPLENLSIQNNEVICHVIIPFTERDDVFEFYKQADRRTFSLAIINSGMYVRLVDNKVKELRLSFGGVSKSAVLATKTARNAIGRDWDETLLHELIPTIAEDLLNGNKVKDETYKVSVATAFLFKFFTLVGTIVSSKEDSSRVLHDIPMTTCSSSQYYDPCTESDQSDIDPVGRPVPNVASEAIVSGEALYIDDLPEYKGELFMSYVLSSRAHANIIHVDPSEALQIEGVVSFIDHDDVPGVNYYGMIAKDEEFYASKEVFYVGQPIGGILAETREIAHKAAKVVKVEYEDLEVILTIEDAIEKESFMGQPMKVNNGDLPTAFSESDRVLEGEYYTGFQEHFYMETHAVLAVPKENDEFEIFCATQGLNPMQEKISAALNIPRNKIFCKTRRIGGSFGCKETRAQMIAIPAVIAAYKVKRPVRLVLPRETDMLITGKRHPFLAKYKVGVDKTGIIKALDISCYSNGGASLDSSSLVMMGAALCIEGCYDIPNIRFRGVVCKTNTPSNTAFRGFGRPQACLIIEEIMYKVGASLDIPAEQIREKNLIKEGHVWSYGTKVTNCTIGDLWKQCKESSKFEDRKKEVEEYNRLNKWKKRGISMTTIQYGIGFGVIFFNQGAALVNIYIDGSVLVSHGGIEMGQGLHTKLNQVAARTLGVPLDKIYTSTISSEIIPNTTLTCGSTTCDFFAPAVISKTDEEIFIHGIDKSVFYDMQISVLLKKKVSRKVEILTTNSVKDALDACNTLNERLKPIKDSNPGASWEDMINKAYFNRVQLSATGFYKPEMKVDIDLEKKLGEACKYHTFGAVCTEVEIDVLTGENQVLQADIVFDVGKSLNPAIDIGQIEGAFVQGMGMVTSEFTDADENGRMINCSPLSYKIPNVRSIPRKLNVTLFKNHNYQTIVYSSKGIGEPSYLAAVSVIEAIKNAVMAARAQIGKKGYYRLDSPATVQRIREACGAQLNV